MKTIMALVLVAILFFTIGCTQSTNQSGSESTSQTTLETSDGIATEVPLTGEEVEDFKEKYGDALGEDFDWNSIN